MSFATLEQQEVILRANLKVVGVGGGGCNAVNSMIKQGLEGVEFIAINTDAQCLDSNLASKKVTIGTKITKGLGAGANPEVGKAAAEEDRAKIEEVLMGADMVFITVGMGGGTGTGAAPIVAQIAKQNGALVVAIVTKPFRYEGPNRMKNAEAGIQEVKKYVDSLIIVQNAKLHDLLHKDAPAFSGFDKPNEILYEATKGIAEVITYEGMINCDFADVRTVMQASGLALMGTGTATGENRAIEAAQKAISSPLLEGMDIRGAKSMLVNITASTNLTMHEVQDGMATITDAAGEDANVIFGLVQKEEMKDYLSFTVIATGFDTSKQNSRPIPTVKPVEKPQSGQSISGQYSHSAAAEAQIVTPTFPIRDLNKDDINTPAFLREQLRATHGADSQVQEQKSFDFKDSKQDNVNSLKFKSNPNSVAKEDEDDQSASFLRMIMD